MTNAQGGEPPKKGVSPWTIVGWLVAVILVLWLIGTCALVTNSV